MFFPSKRRTQKRHMPTCPASYMTAFSIYRGVCPPSRNAQGFLWDILASRAQHGKMKRRIPEHGPGVHFPDPDHHHILDIPGLFMVIPGFTWGFLWVPSRYSSFRSRALENGKTHSRAWPRSCPCRARPNVPAHASPLPEEHRKMERRIPEHGPGAAPARPALMFQHVLLHFSDPDHHHILDIAGLFMIIPGFTWGFLWIPPRYSSFPSRAPENGTTHSRAWPRSCPCQARPYVPAHASHFPDPDHHHILASRAEHRKMERRIPEHGPELPVRELASTVLHIVHAYPITVFLDAQWHTHTTTRTHRLSLSLSLSLSHALTLSLSLSLFLFLSLSLTLSRSLFVSGPRIHTHTHNRQNHKWKVHS